MYKILYITYKRIDLLLCVIKVNVEWIRSFNWWSFYNKKFQDNKIIPIFISCSLVSIVKHVERITQRKIVICRSGLAYNHDTAVGGLTVGHVSVTHFLLVGLFSCHSVLEYLKRFLKFYIHNWQFVSIEHNLHDVVYPFRGVAPHQYDAPRALCSTGANIKAVF